MHAWLEDRAAGDQALISIHDDATSRLMMARFVERDDGAENRRAIIGLPTAENSGARDSGRRGGGKRPMDVIRGDPLVELRSTPPSREATPSRG